MPGKGDFGGFKKGFLLDQKKDKEKSSESSEKPGQLSTGDKQLAFMGVDPKKYHEKKPSDQTESSQSGSSKPSSDFGSLKRGFLLKDEPSQSQAPVDQTQSPEAVVQQDSKEKGKGKQPDQDKGLSRTGESSKQAERLSVFQLEALYNRFEQLSDVQLEHEQSILPEHVRIQVHDYNMKKMIQGSLERGLISQESATKYTKSIDMMTEKKLRGESLTYSDDQITRELVSTLTKLESHKASERLVDEMEDMDISAEEDIRQRVKNMKKDAEASIQLLKDMARDRPSGSGSS